jgi:CMP-N,N'-diacetyllegionaminic acid synthase
MNILITICARGGSKGVPGKNIRPINGKPLIAYSIQTANEFIARQADIHFDVELSTDSEEIVAVAAQYGLVSNYIRPQALATDTAGKVGAIQDVLLFAEKTRQKQYDYVLDLDVTSPLRTMQDLEEGLSQIKANQEALVLFSVSEPHRNPYFNMVELQEDGFAKIAKSADQTFYSRQASPKVYDINGSFYYYTRKFFELGLTSVITDKTLVYLMNHVCFDIDTPLDFDFMEFVLKERKLDFFQDK